MERVRELFSYDPNTGLLTRKVRTSTSTRIGEVAGGKNGEGYWTVKVDGVGVLAHRIAWAIVKGEWPPKLDHRDLNKSNNAWGNLREATSSQNTANCPRRSDNTSGYKGVSFFAGKWKAQTAKDNRVIYLGLFDTPEDAYEAYLRASKDFHGEYARAA